jgi:hypothetical protein
MTGEQLADDPWGELPIEATLTGVESRTVDLVEQAGSDLDELLEAARDDEKDSG